jgi:hypothetical protein
MIDPIKAKILDRGIFQMKPRLERIGALLTAIIILALCLYGCEDVDAAEPNFDHIVHSIYLAEGGSRAKHLYGIVSVPYKNPIEARKICLNTVKNNYHRWIKAGRPGTFIEFLGSRYCPTKGKLRPAEKRLNKYWVSNVKHFYERKSYASNRKLRSQRG